LEPDLQREVLIERLADRKPCEPLLHERGPRVGVKDVALNFCIYKLLILKSQ
jgi:hypothetical protein